MNARNDAEGYNSEEESDARVERALRDTIDTEGYIKAKDLCDATGLSAPAIGQALGRIGERDDGPAVEEWGGQNAAQIYHVRTNNVYHCSECERWFLTEEALHGHRIAHSEGGSA